MYFLGFTQFYTYNVNLSEATPTIAYSMERYMASEKAMLQTLDRVNSLKLSMLLPVAQSIRLHRT